MKEMPKDSEFVSDEVFAKLLQQKKAMGYDKKEWNEWFTHILNQMTIQKSNNNIEKKWEKIYYDQFFNTWVQNFGLNLNNIWNESSARELDPNLDESNEIHEHSAIVIGRGPSAKKHKHLELIANSDYNGSIICTEGALVNALKAGVTPEKFPKYFVVTIDSRQEIIHYYDDPIVDTFGNKINGIFSTIVDPQTVERARQAGIKIHWVHALFDYNEGKKSFNQTSALMVRAKNHTRGLPAIQTGGNVGTSSWFVSWQILKCTTVALIGIDHGWNEDDTWETILSHGQTYSKIKIDMNSPTFSKLFPKIYNPEFNCYCILDPVFQYYREALKEFIARSPSQIHTINATEGGSIFGDRIKCTTLANFLKEYKK